MNYTVIAQPKLGVQGTKLLSTENLTLARCIARELHVTHDIVMIQRDGTTIRTMVRRALKPNPFAPTI